MAEKLTGTYILQPSSIRHEVLPDLRRDGGLEVGIETKGLYILAPGDADLRPDVVTAKSPGYPRQHLIGTLEQVRHLSSALEILDSINPRKPHRQMIIAIGPRIYRGFKEKKGWEDGLPFNESLFRRIGLHEQLMRSAYYYPHPTTVGVWTDLETPFFSCNSVTSDWSAEVRSRVTDEAISLVYAGVIQHEQTHVDLTRVGISGNSLFHERRAMTQQALVLLTFLRSHNSLTKRDKNWILECAAELSSKIYDYRQGCGYEDHLGKLPRELLEDPTSIPEEFQHDDFAGVLPES